jgi:uncharacterized RDD family membrane protein YckC
VVTEHPASSLPRDAEALQGRTAGLVSRTLAAVIDAVVVSAVLLGMYVAIAGAVFVWNPRTFAFPSWSGIVTLTSAWFVATAYLTVGWWTAGRTCGCTMMGLRVVGQRGRGLRFAQALLRAAVCTVFPLGLAWSALDTRSRAVHDLVVRSRVVYDWGHREP